MQDVVTILPLTGDRSDRPAHSMARSSHVGQITTPEAF